MNHSESIAWYSRQTNARKLALLLDIMHQLTIVVRSVFHDHAGAPATTSRLAYAMSELNHCITAASLALLENRPGMPDDALIGLFFDPPQHAELASYFPFVLEQAIQRSLGRSTAH